MQTTYAAYRRSCITCRELYKKLNFSQSKKIREFYEANRCGLFATRDDSGNIIRLSYTPGNDLVFVLEKSFLKICKT